MRAGMNSIANSSKSQTWLREGACPTCLSARPSGLEVQRFGVTHEQQKQFKMYFVKAMITSCIAFNFADNEYLGKALAVLGMAPLTRRQVADSIGRRRLAIRLPDAKDSGGGMVSMNTQTWPKWHCVC
jgi:hypothetical protein